MCDEVWLEAASAVSADDDADLRAEAAEVFAAEAARTRLVDLQGDLRIRLRCGETVRGRVAGESIDGHLVLETDDVSGGGGFGPTLLVPTCAVVHIDGSQARLRDEECRATRSASSWLRERWLHGEIVRILDRTGVTHTGTLVFVGADHVRLDSARCVAREAVDAWWG